jgi:hypothetical protein
MARIPSKSAGAAAAEHYNGNGYGPIITHTSGTVNVDIEERTGG